MARTAINVTLPTTRVRVQAGVQHQQFTNSSIGTLDATGGANDNTFAKGLSANGVALIYDLALAYARGSINHVTNTIGIVGRYADVAVIANQPGEVRLFFGGVEADDTNTIRTGSAGGIPFMAQTQDYPPMFVPNDLTKWTVWRSIHIHDRFFVPIVYNMSASTMTAYRIHVKFYDSQH